MIYEPCILLKPEKIYADISARIDSFCKIEGGYGVFIGKHVHIASFCHINIGGGTTIIEDEAGLASGVKVISGQTDINYADISPMLEANRVHIQRKETKICKGAIIFCNAVISAGVTIGEGAVIGAGSVVLYDVPAWDFWAGVPAKFVSRRIILG